MINLPSFYQTLKNEGVQFIAGVPDTLLNDFCLGLDTHWPKNLHTIAANEGNAIALACGHHLASGAPPLVYMQNSGMGNAMNPLISLTDSSVYSIPLVLLIGWRGEPESGDWPQHQRQGELSPVLLDALKIPYKVLNQNDSSVTESLSWAIKEANKQQSPTALLVRKGVLARNKKNPPKENKQIATLDREEAIRTILAVTPQNSIFVASTGRITRVLHAIREELKQSHQHDFLNVGAMGHSLSIASGLATAQPHRPVICLDGDGAAIMHLGASAVSANLNLPNLIHVLLNNGAHESVGGQPTVGYKVQLNEISKASGFRTLRAPVETADALNKGMQEVLGYQKPSFIEVRIRKGMRSTMPLLKLDLAKAKAEFIKTLKHTSY